MGGGVLMISHNAEFFGDIAPEVWEVPGDQKVHVSGAEWMEAVKAKELAEAKAKKKGVPKQDEEKFDALGNKIETAVAAADIDRDYVKKLTKQLKALKERVKKGDVSAEDEMYEVGEGGREEGEGGREGARQGCQGQGEEVEEVDGFSQRWSSRPHVVVASSRPHVVVASPAYSSFSPPHVSPV